ncbi:MAG: hypothetical protein RIC87_03185 [Kiloniellales bacterium]
MLPNALMNVSRRSLLRGSAKLALAGAAVHLLQPMSALAQSSAVADLVLETVTGPITGADVEKAMAHEHLYVDFHGPNDPKYMDVDWQSAIGASIAAAQELRGQGVNLIIEWTNIGVGRNVLLLRDVARKTGVNIVCPTGIYKSLVPPAMAEMSVTQMADHFIGELTRGVDGTSIRSGFIKIATTEDGATETDRKIHRAAGIAAKETGATVALHSPHSATTEGVVGTLLEEGFKLDRFVWGHSQPSGHDAHLAMVERGATVQFDAIGARSDPFFEGPTDDASMLDRVENIVANGFPNQVILSADASVFVNPAVWQYDRDATYVYRYFEAKLIERLGAENAQRVLRDNVIRAFRRGDKV